jgi:hypothetical protein
MNPRKLSDSSLPVHVHRRGPARENRANPRGRTRAQIGNARISWAATTHAHTAISPLAIFIARCEARTILWQCGEFVLHEAVDVLQQDAVATGLVADIGQDAVQAIIGASFEEVRDGI